MSWRDEREDTEEQENDTMATHAPTTHAPASTPEHPPIDRDALLDYCARGTEVLVRSVTISGARCITRGTITALSDRHVILTHCGRTSPMPIERVTSVEVFEQPSVTGFMREPAR